VGQCASFVTGLTELANKSILLTVAVDFSVRIFIALTAIPVVDLLGPQTAIFQGSENVNEIVKGLYQDYAENSGL
jgi:hypothetical protein